SSGAFVSLSLEPGWGLGMSLDMYRRRGGVLFLSYCRFWERHGFVQQSLARALVKEGVPVVWLDGAGWRPYQPVVLPPDSRLTVQPLSQLPLRRFAPIARWDAARMAREVERWKRRLGGN